MLGKYIFAALVALTIVFSVIALNWSGALGWFLVLFWFFSLSHPTWHNYRAYFDRKKL